MKNLWFMLFNGAVCVFVFREVGMPNRLHWFDAGLLAVGAANGLMAVLHLCLVLLRLWRGEPGRGALTGGGAGCRFLGDGCPTRRKGGCGHLNMNSVRVEVGGHNFTYSDPAKAFAAADSLCKLADQQRAKADENMRAAAAIREQATALAARRKAMAEATAAKKRAGL